MLIMEGTIQIQSNPFKIPIINKNSEEVFNTDDSGEEHKLIDLQDESQFPSFLQAIATENIPVFKELLGILLIKIKLIFHR